ncbi:MAG: hypothetical protein RLZZ367_120, partial [Bacteroidota bacterium]
MFSQTLLRFVSLLRIDKNDNNELSINAMKATAVISSMYVSFCSFSSLIDVSTIKHKPSRLLAAFN